MAAPRRPSDPAAVGVDALAVLAFVVLGRRSHDEGSVLLGTLGTAWPFLAGAGLGWVGVLVARRAGNRWTAASLPAGVTVLAGTVVAGMLLRRATGGGTPPSFVVVASSFLALFLLGWRGLVGWRARRSAVRAQA